MLLLCEKCKRSQKEPNVMTTKPYGTKQMAFVNGCDMALEQAAGQGEL